MELRQLGSRVAAAFLCFCSLIFLLSVAVSFLSSSTSISHVISHVEILTGSAESGYAESMSERVVRLGGGRMLLEGGSATDKGQIVIAEGGAQYIYPEMTLRAYEVAMESGADYVTCMLAMTKDGKAVCHPTMDLSRWTNIASFGELASRKSNFSGTLGLHSFEFTLAEIHQLRVSQTKPANRTTAFDGAFRAATPEEVIGKVKERNKDPKNKRVGIALEINENSAVLPARIDPVKYAIKLLQQQGWTTLDSRAIVISKNETVLELFVRAGVDVQRLIRVPHEGSRAPGKMNLTEKAVMVGTFSASSATGVMLHVDSILRETKVPFWGKSLPVLEWDWQMAGEAANMAGLPIYVWGFTESTWSAKGPHYNTFKFDQLAFYRSLLSQTNQSVAGVATDWPVTAAKAISCYKTPYKLLGDDNRPVPGRPLIIGGANGLMPPHINISYLQSIEDGADYIDCSLQVSRDQVLFCYESIRLEEYSDVAKRSEYKSRKIARPFRELKNRAAYWSFDFNWTEIQTLRVGPPDSNTSAMPALFDRAHPPLSFDKFIDIAQNAKRPVGLFIKLDYPSYLLGKGSGGENNGANKIDVKIDQIGLMMATLRKRGYFTDDNKYNPANGMGLIVASVDKCGLKSMHELSQGTMVLVQRVGGVDNCEAITPEIKGNTSLYWVQEQGIKAMSSYVTGVSPQKPSFINVTADDKLSANSTADEKRLYAILDPSRVREIGQNATKYNLGVHLRGLDFDLSVGDIGFAFNFERDPSIELEYYFNHVGAKSFGSKFVSTVTGFLESSCLPRDNFNVTVPGFKVGGFDTSALYNEIKSVWNPTKKAKDKKKISVWIIVAIVASALMLAAIVAALGCLALRRKRKKKPARDFKKSIEQLITVGTVKHFTQAELLAATNNFSRENKLGKGGFGAVYKGVGTDGTLMAVKKLHVEVQANDSLAENDSVRQLLNEVEIIGTVHNRNVVKLLGICTDKELLLVYEYMPNGSLQEAIFDSSYPIDLGWKHWYNIAVGTAKGLAYLHEDCIQRIIHRDIKPANILLDGQLNPRVADFGLARNVNLAQTHVTTKVMGSLGYVAPEYVSSGHLSERSDTYSFGVLLLTMITRRRPIGPWEHPDDDPTSLEWVKRMAQLGKDELLSVIHPKFKDTYDKEQAIRWLYTALLCTQQDPGLRPEMGDVVLMLSGQRDVPQLTITPAEVILPDYDWRRMSWSREQDDYSKSSNFTSQASGSQPTNDFDDSRDISQIYQGR